MLPTNAGNNQCSARFLAKHRDFTHNGHRMNRLSPMVFFALCAVFDFVWGYIKWHSAIAGLVAIVGGLPVTVFLFFVLRAFGNDDDSGAPRT